MSSIAERFHSPQPDPVTPAPTQPLLRPYLVGSAPLVRDLVTIADGLEGVRRLVDRHGAESVQRWLSHVVALEGLTR